MDRVSTIALLNTSAKCSYDMSSSWQRYRHEPPFVAKGCRIPLRGVIVAGRSSRSRVPGGIMSINALAERKVERLSAIAKAKVDAGKAVPSTEAVTDAAPREEKGERPSAVANATPDATDPDSQAAVKSAKAIS